MNNLLGNSTVNDVKIVRGRNKIVRKDGNSDDPAAFIFLELWRFSNKMNIHDQMGIYADELQSTVTVLVVGDDVHDATRAQELHVILTI